MSANCSVTTGYWFPVIVNSIYLGMSFKRVNRFASAVDHPAFSYLFWWNYPSWGASASKLVARKFFGCNKNLPKACTFCQCKDLIWNHSKSVTQTLHPDAQLLILALPDLVTALFLDLWICLCESGLFSPEDQPQVSRDWVIWTDPGNFRKLWDAEWYCLKSLAVFSLRASFWLFDVRSQGANFHNP